MLRRCAPQQSRYGVRVVSLVGTQVEETKEETAPSTPAKREAIAALSTDSDSDAALLADSPPEKEQVCGAAYLPQRRS